MLTRSRNTPKKIKKTRRTRNRRKAKERRRRFLLPNKIRMTVKLSNKTLWLNLQQLKTLMMIWAALDRMMELAKLTSSSQIESRNKSRLRKRDRLLKKEDSGDPNSYSCQEFHTPPQISPSKTSSRQKETQSVRFVCQRSKIPVAVLATHTWPSPRRMLMRELWKRVAKNWVAAILTSKKLRVFRDQTPPWLKIWQSLCRPIAKPYLWKDFLTISKKTTLGIDLGVLEKSRPSGLRTTGRHNSRKASRTFSLKLMSQPKMLCWKWMERRLRDVFWR